jgi:hypothetical protein
MNKTIKIKKFIDKSAGIYLEDKVYPSLFVDKMKRKMDMIDFYSEADLDLEYINRDILVSKINENVNEPLLYKICKESNYSNEINDYKKFLIWYRENSTRIDLRNIIAKSSHNKILYEKYRKKINNLLYDNRFVSLDIIHCAEISDLKYNEYSCAYNNSKTNIHIYTTNEDKMNIVYIIKIINFFREISKKNMDIDLTIFFCHQKRYLNKNMNLKLTPENINAGSTMIGQYIYIWRKEEFYKVLIHELVHYFSLDFNDFDNSYIEKIKNNIININGNDSINETYTELLAITIYNIFYSTINKINFSKIINYENLFTHFQIAKIINYFGGNNYDDLFKIEIKQSTSVASYVIIKGMFLNNYNKILSHYDNFFGIERSEKYEDYKKLYGLIVKKESLNKNLINHFLNIINNDKENSKKYVMKSLRMTMFDM